ncbi:MAG: [Bacteroidales bacterium]|nr:[citrate (pro-3S)-lyase] ligase [Bacteroidales bacterium]
MMEPFERIDIQELPLSVPAFRRQVEDFLGRNGLRLEEVDLYLAVQDADGTILAGGGLYRDIIKCIAVSEAARSMGLSSPLISRLISVAADRGHTNVKVFTKPENLAIFESLGFRVLASAPKAILMENGRGLEEYCSGLGSYRAEGVIVMNANPFTLGHRYLLEQAAGQVNGLTVIPVKEDRSRFPYAERLDMIRKGSDGLASVPEGSDYQISAATFPTYFLKDLSDASETQMRLDIDLFGRHVAPALGASVRFVGSEPADPLTARYNDLMRELLPSYGVRVVEIPRLRDAEGPVSASRVRTVLDSGRLAAAAALTPSSTRPYLLAGLAERALRMELDTPLKPGLVGPGSSGAHPDMDDRLMSRSIAAIRPFFPRMATAGSPEELRQLGIDAEKAMLAATGGVNSHRGAIFALGLVLAAAGRRMEVVDSEEDMHNRLVLLAQALSRNNVKHSELHSTPKYHGTEIARQYGVKGAREMALEGYGDLFESWLPAYRSMEGDTWRVQKTLLRIISELDDTCIIHRVGYERSREVKKEAKSLLDSFNEPGLKDMCTHYASEGISPGGAADMLALTIFMDSILN